MVDKLIPEFDLIATLIVGRGCTASWLCVDCKLLARHNLGHHCIGIRMNKILDDLRITRY